MSTKSKLNLNRVEMPKQSLEMRKRNFQEVALGYTQEMAEEEAGRCVLNKKGKEVQVAVGRLERYVADWELCQAERQKAKTASASGKKVAIVGPGPAGLTCAADWPGWAIRSLSSRLFTKAGAYLYMGYLSSGFPRT